MTEFPRRQIGRTALLVTELGLGCATLGGSQIAVARRSKHTDPIEHGSV
jgi:aryl-alcohol dehydrogenase-like predicted oxidoreductase